MARSTAKSTITKRFFAWLLPIVAGFIMKRITKRLTRAQKSEKPGRKYVKNKAD